MHKILYGLLLFVFLTPTQGAITPRGGAQLLNSNAYSFSSEASFFKTSSYYDYQGVEVKMNEGDQFSLMDLDLAASYGVSSKLEFTVFGRLRKASSTSNDVISESSGPESVGLEGKYSFANFGNVTYVLGLHYRQTLYKNKNYIDTTEMGEDALVIGDAGSEYGVDLYMTYLQSLWKLDGKFGYSSPANFLSSELNYKVEVMRRFNSLGLFAGFVGIYSLKTDEFSEEPGKKAVQNTGASTLFNSINHQYVAPYLGINYAFENFNAGLKAQTVMSGTSTDKGHTISLNVAWNSGGTTPESVKIDSFKEYHIEGSVLKISDKKNFVRIDQGISTDVEKGMKFDIYQTDYFGGNVLVASGVVYQVGPDWSVIRLLKMYKKIAIKPGFAARGY